MSSLKCPRCNADIKETDVFCMSCGNPVKADVDAELKKEEKNENVKDTNNIQKEIVNKDADVIASGIFGFTCSSFIYKMKHEEVDVQKLFNEIDCLFLKKLKA